MATVKYTCAACGETHESDRSDEEATVITMPGLQTMENEAIAYRGRPDDAWIGQYHLGSDDALELIELARCELERRILAKRSAYERKK